MDTTDKAEAPKTPREEAIAALVLVVQGRSSTAFTTSDRIAAARALLELAPADAGRARTGLEQAQEDFPVHSRVLDRSDNVGSVVGHQRAENEVVRVLVRGPDERIIPIEPWRLRRAP